MGNDEKDKKWGGKEVKMGTTGMVQATWDAKQQILLLFIILPYLSEVDVEKGWK